jgi:DNA-binding transcriptional MerR regulator
VFRISDFSRLTRVSIKTLRHYDRIGLLSPAFVDPVTRYRHYSARQAVRLQLVLALREFGIPLARIAELIEEDGRGRRFRRALEERRAALASMLEEDRRRLAQIDARLAGIRNDQGALPPDVVLRPVAAVRVASLRARVESLDDGVEALFERLEEKVAKAKARASGPPILIYHDADRRSADADVEAAVPVIEARRIPGVRRRVVPGIAEAACFVYRGDYGQWGQVLGGLLRWLQARRLSPSGPMREVYLQFSARDPRALRLPVEYIAGQPDDRVTEVQIPVRLGARAARRVSAPFTPGGTGKRCGSTPSARR